jgi:hypothetical protein
VPGTTGSGFASGHTGQGQKTIIFWKRFAMPTRPIGGQIRRRSDAISNSPPIAATNIEICNLKATPGHAWFDHPINPDKSCGEKAFGRFRGSVASGTTPDCLLARRRTAVDRDWLSTMRTTTFNERPRSALPRHSVWLQRIDAPQVSDTFGMKRARAGRADAASLVDGAACRDGAAKVRPGPARVTRSGNPAVDEYLAGIAPRADDVGLPISGRILNDADQLNPSCSNFACICNFESRGRTTPCPCRGRSLPQQPAA